jgi:hypothetical protein
VVLDQNNLKSFANGEFIILLKFKIKHRTESITEQEEETRVVWD